MLSVSRRYQNFAKFVCMACLCGSVSADAVILAEDGASPMSQRIDELISQRLTEAGWQAAESCTDAAFVRRVHLDLTGVPPSAHDTLAFLESKLPNKRSSLVERLVLSPAYANHFAETWAGWMLPEQTDLFRPQQGGLSRWLRARFAENLRYDRLVADLMVATGPVESGPAEFFVALENKPEKIAAKTARIFMGVQLDCAECHDHPFDDWSQRDFWAFAAYFAQLGQAEDGQVMVARELRDNAEGEVKLPGTEEIVSPRPLVGARNSQINAGTRRQQLTLWLTTRENAFLAQATVNRVWSLLMGRGIIEPIDDMRSVEMASHPELLTELSDYFVSTGYDLRDLVKVIANTEAYARATLHPSGEPPEGLYATMLTKPLTERQLLASTAAVARSVAGNEQVLPLQLGKLRGDASEAKLGIVNALVMLHGDLLDSVSRENSSRLLKALSAPHFDNQKLVRWLYLSTLNRLPSTMELQGLSEFTSGGEDETWKSDLLWALLNSTEFAMTP